VPAGRPPKPDDEKLVLLSVRVPAKSLQLLDRIVEGERAYLRQRHLPTHGVNRSAAFRSIWELGEVEYFLQRAILWVTRKVNRYTVEQAAEVLGWEVETVRELLRERGVDVGPAPPKEPPPPPPPLDPGFLI
jgi:hypothetical protein